MIRSLFAAIAVAGSLLAASTGASAQTPNRACSPTMGGTAVFTDVGAGGVHADAVRCLAHHGIAEGFGDGRFAPEAEISHAQMATFMKRALRSAGVVLAHPPATEQGFADLVGWRQDLRGNMEQLARMSPPVVRAESSDNFGPDRVVTRAEMADIVVAFLHHASERVDWPSRADRVRVNNRLAPVSRFTDLNEQPNHIRRAVDGLASLEVAHGVTATRFEPEQPVTRAQMAAFIARALAHTGIRYSPASTLEVEVQGIAYAALGGVPAVVGLPVVSQERPGVPVASRRVMVGFAPDDGLVTAGENAGIRGDVFTDTLGRGMVYLTRPADAAPLKQIVRLTVAGGGATAVTMYWGRAGLPSESGAAFLRWADIANDSLVIQKDSPETPPWVATYSLTDTFTVRDASQGSGPRVTDMAGFERALRDNLFSPRNRPPKRGIINWEPGAFGMRAWTLVISF